jgi:hypothetical protein
LQALENIAEISERHPGSAEMMAAYLRQVVSIEQVGYCQRIGESAAQYAERLLAPKGSKLAAPPSEIARRLVYEYKDHGFVIDAEEAEKTLGEQWIRTETKELALAEHILRNYERLDLWLRLFSRKHLVVFGDFADGVAIYDRSARAEGGLTGR